MDSSFKDAPSRWSMDRREECLHVDAAFGYSGRAYMHFTSVFRSLGLDPELRGIESSPRFDVTPESRQRMLRLLDVWSVGGTELYDLRAIDHKRGLKTYRFAWDQQQFDRSRRFISRLNVLGSTVYVRPSSRVSTHPWILIDRVSEQGLALLERNVPPAAVLESALRPDEFQAWVRIEPAMPEIERNAAARFVADLVGASGNVSYSWLPGTTDRDPQRAPADGVFPFVRFRSVSRDAWTPIEGLERAHGFSRPGLEGVSELTSPNAPAARRQNARDFAVAMRLIEGGYSDVAIRAALEQLCAETGDGDRDEYVRRTIRNARERATVRTRSGRART